MPTFYVQVTTEYEVEADSAKQALSIYDIKGTDKTVVNPVCVDVLDKNRDLVDPDQDFFDEANEFEDEEDDE